MLITEPVALVLGTGGVILVGMIIATLVPRLLAGHGPFPSRIAGQSDATSAMDLDPGALIGGLGDQFDGAMSSADRIVRIVAWVFLLVTAAVVGASNLWPDTSAAIYVLLGLTGLFVLAVYDLMPPSALGAMRYVIEGTVALVMATLLLALTGGHASPFFFTFPLIVGAASLVVQPRATLVLAVGAIVGYLVAAFVGSGNPTPAQLVTTAANLTALLLLAYVGSVIGGEQRRSRDAAIRLSAMDPLTGLFNRTLFFAALEREMDRSARSGRGFCLLMMDLDELKGINDRHGHHAGDVVLREIADRIRSGVRRIDVAARYGGDEFVALLPETDPTGGWVLAEKIRLSVAALDVPGIGGSPTISVGVVAYPRDGESVDALMVKADLAMYASKRAGRNRVAGPSSDPTPDLSKQPTEVSGRPV
ncbi:MAG: GGDEF domain-containing protein [Chloroflexota bacterium]